MENKEQRNKRILASVMSMVYCFFQTLNLYVSIHELIDQQ